MEPNLGFSHICFVLTCSVHSHRFFFGDPCRNSQVTYAAPQYATHAVESEAQPHMTYSMQPPVQYVQARVMRRSVGPAIGRVGFWAAGRSGRLAVGRVGGRSVGQPLGLGTRLGARLAILRES